MNRTRITSTALALSALVALGPIATAQAAVTNPANNPHRIEVIGDDGATYVDGQDTLPGYDDEACTYIPGAYFDFASNRVYYPGGVWIPWTEWDRATGYQEWLAGRTQEAKTASAAPATPTARASAQPDTAPTAAGAEATPASAPAATSGAAVDGSTRPAVAPVALPNNAEPLGTATPDRAPGALVGFVILGGLTATGALAYTGHDVRRRLRKGDAT